MPTTVRWEIRLYAGARVCYQRDRSLGLFQKMRTDNMHVAVMFINASTGQGGSLQFAFDDNFNAASSDEHPQPAYRGLCADCGVSLRRTLLVPKESRALLQQQRIVVDWLQLWRARCGGRSLLFCQHEPIGPLLQKLSC